ncbi:MAG: hypothetical protein K8S16_19275 [Bacteroidales bacterium]|nr:hypothetical protein [Bacteroidales bacterium]
MQIRILIPFFFILVALGGVSCKCHIKSAEQAAIKEEATTQVKAGPAVIIYKTSGKYYNKVPVGMSEDKKAIVNFPGPKDIYYKGEFAFPTMLENGYLLDNRGIDENSAFLDITYEEYSKLKKAPSPGELFTKILDNDPFTEMYYCGSRFDYTNLEAELNEMISDGGLVAMKRLK